MDGVGYERECAAFLLTAGFDHRKHGLHEAAATRALRTERQLPPNDRVAKSTFAGIVGYFHIFVVQKGPKPLPMVIQFVAHAHQTLVAAEGTAQQQGFDRSEERR